MFRTISFAVGMCVASLLLLAVSVSHGDRTTHPSAPRVASKTKAAPPVRAAARSVPVHVTPNTTTPLVNAEWGKIVGVVLGPDGKAAEGVELRVEPADCRITKTPSVDGALEIEAPPGKASVFARAIGYAIEVRRVEVPSGGKTRVEIVLGQGKGVLEGRITTGSGQPAVGALVECVATSGEPGQGSTSVMGSSKTDAQGQYSIRGFAEGDEVEVRVAAEGYPTVLRGPVRVSAKHLDVVVGEAAYASLAGRVTTSEPAPAEFRWELKLSRVGEDGTLALFGEFAPGRPAETDIPQFNATPDGKFALRNLLPGTYVVSATGTGLAPTELGPLTLPAGASLTDLTIVFGKGRSIAGVVRGTASGQPIAGVAISIQGSGVVLARTAADGSFQVTHLGPGHYVLRATHEAYRDAQVEVDVPSDVDVTGVRVTMDDSPALAGKVTDAEGKPVLAGKVTAIREGERREAEVKDGAYEIHGLAGGSYRVWAQAPGCGQVMLSGVTVSANGRTAKDLRLTKGGTVRLTIQSNGRGVAGAKATLRWKDGLEVQPIVLSGSDGKACEGSGADGVLVIELVPTSPLLVTVTRGDHTCTKEVSLVDGVTLDLPIAWPSE